MFQVSVKKYEGVLKVIKKKKKRSQGSEYNLVDKTATTLSTGYIRFIASGSELRHVRGEGKDD